MTSHRVPAAADGQRADVVVAGLLGISRSRAARRFAEAAVTRDGRPLRRSEILHADEVVEVAAEPAPQATPSAPAMPPIRWEDGHLLVLAKPAGLVVHPGAGHEADTLADAMRAAGIVLAPAGGPGRPGIVHRLDKDTSGLLVVAKTDVAHAGLVQALRRREVERHYLALAEGTLPSARGRIDAPIRRDPRDRQRFAALQDGKAAVTHWQVQATGRVGTAPVTLVACRLETGRTHQIRVHLSFAGAPVAGDVRYGASAGLAGRIGLDRMFLHAATLGFTHPVTAEPVQLTEPLPADLVAAAEAAGVEVASVEVAGVEVAAPRFDPPDHG